jgi:hypothetical protein
MGRTNSATKRPGGTASSLYGICSSVKSLRGLSAYAENPSFVSFLNHLNITVTGVREEFAMFVDAEEPHAGSRDVFFGELGSGGVRPFVDFGDDDELAAGLEDSKDFAHVSGQVGSPEVGFDGGDEIERVVRKRELRDRAGANFDSPEFYPACAGYPAQFGLCSTGLTCSRNRQIRLVIHAGKLRDASVTLTGMCPYAGAKAMTDELHYFAVVRFPPL